MVAPRWDGVVYPGFAEALLLLWAWELDLLSGLAPGLGMLRRHLEALETLVSPDCEGILQMVTAAVRRRTSLDLAAVALSDRSTLPSASTNPAH